MLRALRSHRRASPVVDALVAGGLFIGLLLAVLLLRVGMAAASELFDGAAWLLFFVVIGGGVGLRTWWLRHRKLRAERELRHWELSAGWEPAAWRWPWQELVRWADTVTVLRAYAKRVEGLPVRTGELEFDDNGLGATVDRRAGRAAFAIVALPRPAPPMSVRVYRQVGRVPAGEDAFRHRFQLVGAEADRLVGPELRAAHVRDDIPPWTVVGDELFVFVPLDGPLRPSDLEDAARRAILVVRLLKLDSCNEHAGVFRHGVGSAVEIGEDG